MIGRVAQLTALPYQHLASLSDERGIFEHALHETPRPEHGYCLDDVARALTVAVREPRPTAELDRLTGIYLGFIDRAIDDSGSAHNRMDATGTFTDEATVGDWWGRAVGALGIAAASASSSAIRRRATRIFSRAARQRSPHVRAMSFAVLGAAEVLAVRLGRRPARGVQRSARALVDDAVRMLPTRPMARWQWVEPRLRYANATVAEAALAASVVTADGELRARALYALDALLDIESRDGRISVTGPDGRGPGDVDEQYDQQPIEVAAIADACARAYAVTGDARWAAQVDRAWAWFAGDNDSGERMVDLATGAGYDGLEPAGRNDNRGAESTLAALSTNQWARALHPLWDRS